MDIVIHKSTLGEWLTAAAIAGISLALAYIISRVAVGRLRAMSEKTNTDLDDLVVTLIEKTKLGLLALVSTYAGALALPNLPEMERTVLEKAAIVALFVQLAIWGTTGIKFVVRRHRERSLAEDASAVTTMAAFGVLGRIGVWTVLLLAVLQNFGVEISALVTGLGIGGVAVALAVQNVLGDVLGSLSIALDKPFVIGDFLIVDNLMGTVERIGLKTTRLRSLSGEMLVFSNNDLLRSRIRNYKLMQDRRVAFRIGVTYQTSPEALEEIPPIIEQAISEEEHARFDRCHFFEFSEFSLDFETVYYVEIPDYPVYMDIQQRVNLKIIRAFRDKQIEFAYPTRTLFHEGSAPKRATA